jgi:diketogulonate reductase-like aldo/keto reductase
MQYRPRVVGQQVHTSHKETSPINTDSVSLIIETQCTPEDVRRSVQDSLDKLGFIPDLYLLHNPLLVEDQEGKNIEDMYALVEDLVFDGTLKGCSLGLSNFR